MESYSLWQMGRTDGRFSSMLPHSCPVRDSLHLGSIELGMQTISTIAQFGIWYELHQMNKLSKAQFEERRLKWLDDILERWLAENRDQTGISIDSTKALCRESNKLIEKLGNENKMDAPQVLLLKAKRVADYMDELNKIWCTTLSRTVSASKSDPQWIVPPMDSGMFVSELIEQSEDQHRKDISNIRRGLLGAAAFYIPVIGPAIGGGLIAVAISSSRDRKPSLPNIARLSNYPELLRLSVAAEQLLLVSATVEAFLERQDFPSETNLYAISSKTSDTDLYLGPTKKRLFYKRILSSPLQLKKLGPPNQQMMPA